jgi:hypothetical protein
LADKIRRRNLLTEDEVDELDWTLVLEVLGQFQVEYPDVDVTLADLSFTSLNLPEQLSLWDSHEVVACFTNDGSRIHRDRIFFSMSRFCLRLTHQWLERRGLKGAQYADVGSELLSALFVAILDELEKWPKPGESGELRGYEIEHPSAYLCRVATRAIGVAELQLPLLGPRDKYRADWIPPLREELTETISYDARVTGSVEEAIDYACAQEPDPQLARRLIRLRQLGYSFKEIARRMPLSQYQAQRAANRIYKAVCDQLNIKAGRLYSRPGAKKISRRRAS